MAFTQTDLDAVNAAMASGELQIEVAGRMVKYRSIDELIKARDIISAELAAERDVYETFTRNVQALTHGNVVAHRMGWREFFGSVRWGQCKLIHIDAEHTYNEVYDNITAVLPLMVPGGIICGDDAHHEPVISAVIDRLGEYERRASLWIWQAP